MHWTKYMCKTGEDFVLNYCFDKYDHYKGMSLYIFVCFGCVTFHSRYDCYVHEKVSLAFLVCSLYLCLIDTVCQNRCKAEKQISVFDINM